ncbi:MAG TPA: DUF6492 family protein [Spirochaetia bacterium]|nr:DUF6492 family protein [Spirochaetia bacterium]
MIKIIDQLSNDLNYPIIKYYLSNPLILLKNRFTILLLKLKKIIGKDINFSSGVKSNIPIDVVMCAIDKDYDVLVHVIDSIRKYIKHPICNIYLICPISERISKIAKDKKCILIDENKVLPITKKNIIYTVNGQNRSGWLFQQLLKWSADKFVTNEYFLITEADTAYCRPQVFIHNHKVLIPVSNQFCHLPYFAAIKRLIGKKVDPIINLTSHHSLFEKTKLKALKHTIEKKCKVVWWQGIINKIDHKQGASVSDYETYGQFVYLNYPDDFEKEFWYNHSFKRSQLKDIKNIIRQSRNKYKNISFHSYDE